MVVLLPDPLKDVRKNRGGCLGGVEANPLAKRESVQVVREGAVEVRCVLMLPDLTSMGPVMTEAPNTMPSSRHSD